MPAGNPVTDEIREPRRQPCFLRKWWVTFGEQTRVISRECRSHALARKFAWRIQPNGATAQNLLGLSAQVPARAVYLSDGPVRSYTVGRTKLDFEHTALKEAGFKLPESRLIVHALKAFGEERITPKVITQIRRQFDSALRQRILLDTKTATGWVYAAIQEIAREGANG